MITPPKVNLPGEWRWRIFPRGEHIVVELQKKGRWFWKTVSWTAKNRSRTLTEWDFDYVLRGVGVGDNPNGVFPA